MRRHLKSIALVGLILLGLLISSVEHKGFEAKNSKGPFAFALEQPSSLNSAFPSDKAGLTAYIKINQTIDPQKVAEIFVDLEDIGGNYAIGTIEIKEEITDFDYVSDPLYYGHVYIHVYVDNTGWIVTYLERNDSIGAVIYWSNVDIDHPEITETTLSMAIKAVCNHIGVDYGSIRDKIKYYDFKYPSATKMLITLNTLTGEYNNIMGDSTESMYLKIPSTFTLYQVGFSLIGPKVKLSINGKGIPSSGYYYGYAYGDISDYYLTTGVLYTIKFHNKWGGGIVLLYSEG